MIPPNVEQNLSSHAQLRLSGCAIADIVFLEGTLSLIYDMYYLTLKSATYNLQQMAISHSAAVFLSKLTNKA